METPTPPRRAHKSRPTDSATRPQESRSQRPSLPASLPASKPRWSNDVNRKMERLQEFLSEQQTPLIGRPRSNRLLRHLPIWIWPGTAAVTILTGIVVWKVADSQTPDRDAKQELATVVSRPAVSEPASSESVSTHPDQSPVANPPEPPAKNQTSGPAKREPMSLANSARTTTAKEGALEAARAATPSVTAIPANENSSIEKSTEQPDQSPPTEKRSAAPAPLAATDLAGWENPGGAWRVQRGMLVGTVQNTLAVLRSKEKYKDFDLRFRVRLKDGSGNCGVRFRMQDQEPTDGKTDGLECVIHRTVKDKTYGIGSLAKGSMDKPDVFVARGSAARFVKAGDFNQLHIRCEGEQVLIQVNHMTTISKMLSSMADEGHISLELDGRHQSGEVEFKDFKFTDLGHPAGAKLIARSAAASDAIVKAKVHYFQSVEKAGKKLLAAFDLEIKKRTEHAGDPKGNPSGTIAMLESEKDAFVKKRGRIPWSKPMRSASEAYMGELDSYQRQVEKAFEDEIKLARKHGNPETVKQLQDAEDEFLAPHLVATAECDGARLLFRSDGLVDSSKDQIARRWRISTQRHTDLILKRAGDSDEENSEQEVFHIAADGKSLTGSKGDEHHVWEFVRD